MKYGTLRNRALRAALGGMVMSSLSEAELRKVAKELDFEFIADLKEMLLALPFRFDSYQADLYEHGGESDLSVLLYEKCKAKRLSKERMLAYMKQVDQASALAASSSASNLRELVEGFVARAGPDGGSRLLGRLSGQLEQDPYLAGISERR